MAKRMGAKTIEVKASHLSLISHPDTIANLILKAAGQSTPRFGPNNPPAAPYLSRPIASVTRFGHQGPAVSTGPSSYALGACAVRLDSSVHADSGWRWFLAAWRVRVFCFLLRTVVGDQLS